jgi:4-amino-4-deoxy-L-arabinose transferase-like glycosyltransferase
MATATADPRLAPAPKGAHTAKPGSRHPVILFALALIAVFAAQARTLSFYYFQDDYVPYGEIVTNGARTYTWNLITAQDLTPNWRVLPGLLYLANEKLFGMDPVPARITLLAFHLGTVALLYRIAWRATSNAWAAFTAAVIFGLHPTYAGALGQIAVAPHIMAAFFLVATLNAVFESARAESSRGGLLWWAASVALYVLALMSNESMAIMFPAFGLAFLLFDTDRDLTSRLLRATVRTLPLAAVGLAAAFAFSTCGCTEADSVYSTDNAFRAFFIYAGRLLYPIGLEPPFYIDPPHLFASIALLAVAVAMLAFGPAIGRIGVVWMVLALIPHIFVSTHTANRFTYLATPGFALLAAGCVLVAADWLRRLGTWAAPAAVAGMLALLAPWYAWQTHLQNEPWRKSTDDWQLLHDELDSTFPEVPPGATVEVIGGPLTHPLDNFFVMPALAQTIWGPETKLQTFADSDPYADTIRGDDQPFAARFEGRDLVPLR